MKRVALVLVIFGAVTLSASGVSIGAPGNRVPQARGAFVEDEVLVKFKSDVNPVVVARSVGARLHSQIEGLGVHILKVPPGSVEGTVRALSNNTLVEFAEPNGYMQAFVVPNDPFLGNQWSWGVVKAYQAWDVTQGSASVTVAVVDTGIDVGGAGIPDDTPHPDLNPSANCPGRPSVILKSYVSGETGNDDNGHGTHVAGIIGACTNNPVPTGVAGANWYVQLMAVKVLDYSGSGTYSAVASGIKWAADHSAKVINLSLGGGPSLTVKNAVDYAWNKGVVLACAAGNSGNTSKSYPAAYTNCIAVAATDSKDNIASFSSRGSDWVDVAAPGVNIFSTMQDNYYWCFLCYWYGYPTEYATLSGTSMAAPHVAGLAALIWAKGLATGTCTTNSCVRSKIESTADTIAFTGTYWAKGRVNYCKALGGVCQ